MTSSRPVTPTDERADLGAGAEGDVSSGRFGPGRLALAVSLVAIWFLSLRNATDFDLGWHLANGRHLADGVLLGGARRLLLDGGGCTVDRPRVADRGDRCRHRTTASGRPP